MTTHDQPWFEGKESRRHRAIPIWRLKLKGLKARLQGLGMRRGETSMLVQFLGFPRSGHSVVGALLDAHPEAIIAHELDLMGLVAKGVSVRSALALAHDNARRFAAQGRFWNGYSYEVEGGHGGNAETLRVIGDKKGDRALTALLENPDLADRLHSETGLVLAWIVVVRNPFDNIATMELRRGRTYDRLRVAHGNSARFEQELRKSQGEDVPEQVSEAIVQAYAAQLHGLETALAALEAAGNPVVTIHHDNLSDNPTNELVRLAEALGIAPYKHWLEGAARLIKPASRSRDKVKWKAQQVKQVEMMINDSELLAPYRDQEALTCSFT
ncbi:hypothetical protein J3454_11205 [Erythrobacter sp. NFXS35]|uniref:hypothetical protein n=1 Tax=Erythrobacter sp. NFXS35 TaxID=2818436 RepID=UPI0032DEF378